MPRSLVALVVLVGLAGCGASGTDRAGGDRAARVVVLTFADGDPGLDSFVSAVRRLSHGTIQIRFGEQGLKGPPDYEARIIADVRAGKADLGWVGSREFPGFDALTAPLLIDSYAFEAEVLRSPVIAPMLHGLEPLGLMPIGVLPGPLRRPAGARPLREPADFEGLRIGSQRGNMAAATLKVLGAVPVPVGPSQLVRGLDGVESHAGSIAGNGYITEAPFVTGDVALWPRPPVLFAGPRAHLTPGQLALLRRAARESMADEIAALRNGDRVANETLCALGARVLVAGARRRAAVRAATRPVYAQLERTHPAVVAIARMRARFTGPPDALRPCTSALATPKTGVVSPVDGVYRMYSTKEQLEKDQPGAVAPENWGAATVMLDRGLMIGTQENAQACTWSYGTFAVSGDVLVIHYRGGGGITPTHATMKPGERLAFRWRRYRDRLTMSGGVRIANTDSPPGTAVLTRVGDHASLSDFPRRCPPPRAALGP